MHVGDGAMYSGMTVPARKLHDICIYRRAPCLVHPTVVAATPHYNGPMMVLVPQVLPVLPT